MKINKEKFEELSQLDRIEFMQKSDNIRRVYSGNSIFFLLGIAWISIITGVLLDILSILKFGEGIKNMGFYVTYAIIVIILGIFFFFVEMFFRYKYLNKIEERFFEIKLRGKK